MGNSCLGSAPVEIKKTEEAVVDWSNEGLVHHRSAINSLHNFALGKMKNLGTCETSRAKRVTSSPQKGLRTSTLERLQRSQSISFATELHQTFFFERQSMSIDCDPKIMQSVGFCTDIPGTDQSNAGCSPQPLLPITSNLVTCGQQKKAAGSDRGTNSCRSAMPQFPCAEDDAPSDTARFLRIE